MSKFTVKEALKFGWEKTNQHFKYLVLVMLATWAATFAVGLAGGSNKEPSFREFIGFILSFILSIILQIGLIRISLKILNDVKGDLRDFLPTSKLFWQVTLGTILYGLIVIGGLILLIVPGIIWSIKYRFYSYLIVDKGMSATEAIKESGRITQGEKWNLFVYMLACILLVLVGAIALLIGLLWAIPTVLIAMAYIYKKLTAEGFPVAASVQ